MKTCYRHYEKTILPSNFLVIYQVITKLLFTLPFIYLRLDRCFALNAKIPERDKFPKLNRTYISLRDSKHERRTLKGKATISRCFTTVIKRDFALRTATNASIRSRSFICLRVQWRRATLISSWALTKVRSLNPYSRVSVYLLSNHQFSGTRISWKVVPNSSFLLVKFKQSRCAS